MTRRHDRQVPLAQVALLGVLATQPEDLMGPVLRTVDEILDDEALVEAVLHLLRQRRPRSARWGRPGTPAEVVLRLLVLKHLRAWSYEQLVWEVTGNLVYRRFCRIEGAKVPDDKTLIKLGKYLEPTLRPLFHRVVVLATKGGATRGRKMRLDTTVVEALIHYPTDSGLCEDAVRVLRRGMRRLAESGVKLPFRLRDVRRSVSRRMREIGQALRLRGEAARETIKKPYRGLLRVTARMVRQAQKAVVAAHEQMDQLPPAARRKVERTLVALEPMVPRARQVVRQTRLRVFRSVSNSEGKLISLFESWAQILRRGKPHRPTEFGMMVKVQEAEGGVVTDIALVPEKADAPLLVPSVEHHIQVFGRAPQLLATDRGFYSTDGERRVIELGVRHAVLPKPGHRSRQRIDHERQRWFRRGRAWRVGGEARIARLKHRFGMARSRYRGQGGLKRTVYWAAIANNLIAMGKSQVRAERRPPRRPP